MLTTEELKNLKELASKATSGPGEIKHTHHIATEGLKEKIINSVSESIDASINYDGGHSWWFIETNDGRTVAHFGCGPTSEANAAFWGLSRDAVPKLIEMVETLQQANDNCISLLLHESRMRNVEEKLEKYQKALDVAFSHIDWIANYSIKYKGTDAGNSAKRAIEKINAILGE